ncbi:MAG: CBS domain-containing protein [Planctomycetes bacterium]|nr:CBS domain-containing protein [Planctomycetota bacterium]
MMQDKGSDEGSASDVLERLRLASDIMTTDVKTLTMDHTVGAFLKFMKSHHVRHAPVTDQLDTDAEPRFVGVVSQRDVLRQMLPHRKSDDPGKDDPRALRRLLARTVTRKPYSVKAEATVEEVINLMLDHHVDMAPVVEEDRLCGVITSVDVLRIFARIDKVLLGQGKGAAQADKLIAGLSGRNRQIAELTHQPVEKIMTREVVCMQPDNTLGQAREMIVEHKFRHLPVVDEDGVLAGIISDRDILGNLPLDRRQSDKRGRSKSFPAHLYAIDDGGAALSKPLSEIMTTDVITIPGSTSAFEAAAILVKKRFGALIVVGATNKVRGIITPRDLMAVLLAVYGDKEP